jgi:pimeloyl-ACP methyl ester carboxylesterase
MAASERWSISERARLAALAIAFAQTAGCCLTSAVYPAPQVAVPPPAPPRLELAVPVPGGDAVVGWLEEAPTPSAPAILFLHGNGQNLATLAKGRALARMQGLPAHVLTIDYPGYGRSAGKPSEAALVAAARAALAALHARHPDSPLFLVGWSLGAAVAVQVARGETAAGPGGTPLAGLALLSPWTSLLDAADHRFPRWLARLFICDCYDSAAAAGDVKLPTLVVHGARDDLVPAEQGRHLAAALPGLRSLVIVDGAEHNDLLAFPQTWAALAAFVAAEPRP